MQRPAASRRFGAQLSPVNCRRPDTRPVGCYAVLGRVAASGPTSWLSARPDILGHSAATWGPWRAVWAVPLSGAELSSRVLTPRPWPACVRSSVPFGRLRRPLGDPVALPPAGCPAGPPESGLGEYEISPGVVGRSPLPRGRPRPFQRTWVRASTGSHPRFALPRGGSPGFASAAGDCTSPCSDSPSLRLGSTFASPPAATRWLILQ